MGDQPWLLLDTETNGLKAPIYVVELAAQRMRGWEPDGEPFQRMLNHGIEIPPEAARVNGYTREILERDGEAPHEVYTAFADYVGDRPMVAYNLSYDLDSVLLPEWARLGLEPISRPGFCALRLAQRLLDPVLAGNHKLQTLRQHGKSVLANGSCLGSAGVGVRCHTQVVEDTADLAGKLINGCRDGIIG
ncbi:MAG: 3'-5' exonuclease, partial [Chromatiaceae bacterium]|nr:3'-5' exonuclease [Chromatiaceae bacterium]